MLATVREAARWTGDPAFLTRILASGDAMPLEPAARRSFELLEATRPDVIVSDIAMPEEDGLAFIRRLRALPEERAARIPAIAVSAFAGSSEIRNAQPFVFDYAHGSLAIAHNGNLVNARELRSRLESSGSIFQTASDTEVIVHLLAQSHEPEAIVVWGWPGSTVRVFHDAEELGGAHGRPPVPGATPVAEAPESPEGKVAPAHGAPKRGSAPRVRDS